MIFDGNQVAAKTGSGTVENNLSLASYAVRFTLTSHQKGDEEDYMPDVKTAQQITESQYVFGILFVLLFLAVSIATTKLFNDLRKENTKREKALHDIYDEHKRESREHEQKLMDHLERTNKAHERTSETLEKIQHGLVTLEVSVKEMWVEIK